MPITADEYGSGLAWDLDDWEKVALASSQLLIGKHYGNGLSDNQETLAQIIYDLAQRNVPESSYIKNHE